MGLNIYMHKQYLLIKLKQTEKRKRKYIKTNEENKFKLNGHEKAHSHAQISNLRLYNILKVVLWASGQDSFIEMLYLQDVNVLE